MTANMTARDPIADAGAGFWHRDHVEEAWRRHFEGNDMTGESKQERACGTCGAVLDAGGRFQHDCKQIQLNQLKAKYEELLDRFEHHSHDGTPQQGRS